MGRGGRGRRAGGGGGSATLGSAGQFGNVGSTLFAVGSTIFAYLFLRARSIPVVLARAGVIASAILAVAIPLQMAGFLGPPLTAFKWIPIFGYEIVLAGWLLIKGAAASVPRASRYQE